MNKYVIGEWIFDPATHSLSRQSGGEPLMLENRQAQLLIYFCERRGRDLSKNELLDLWQPRVVQEDALYVAIAGLRKALGDNSRSPTYLKTIPGIGYRLVAPVCIQPPSQEKRRQGPSVKQALALAVLLLIAIGGFGGWLLWNRAAESPPDLVSDDFRRAKFLLGKGEAFQAEGISLLRQIMAITPDFADAYAVAADTQVRRAAQLHERDLAEVEQWISRALTLAPDHPQAHLAKANLLFLVHWRIADARQHFEAALGSPQSYLDYANYLVAVGELDRALEMVHRHQDLDPEGYGLTSVAWIHIMAGRHQEALAAIDRLHALEPGNPYYHVSRQGIFEARGEFSLAFKELIWVMENAGYSGDDLAEINNAFAAGGLPSAYRWLAQTDTRQLSLGQYAPPLSLARYFVSAGDLDAALQYLEQAVESRQTEVLWLGTDPKYRPLYPEPRFVTLVQRLGLTLREP